MIDWRRLAIPSRRSERLVACDRCGRTVGLRADGAKRAHGTAASPPECREGGEAPSADELTGERP